MLASEFPRDYDNVTSFSQVLLRSIDDGLIGEVVRLMIQC
jgi:hypothetical protein